MDKLTLANPLYTEERLTYNPEILNTKLEKGELKQYTVVSKDVSTFVEDKTEVYNTLVKMSSTSGFVFSPLDIWRVFSQVHLNDMKYINIKHDNLTQVAYIHIIEEFMEPQWIDEMYKSIERRLTTELVGKQPIMAAIYGILYPYKVKDVIIEWSVRCSDPSETRVLTNTLSYKL